MSEDRKYRDEEWLREQYLDKQYSFRQIADECGAGATTIREWADRFGIPTRSEGGRAADRRLADREWVRKKYIKEQKGTADIAQICECTQVCVWKWLQKHGIEIRGREADSRLTDSEWLQREYAEKERSGVGIAEECDCSPETVYTWLRKHGIKRQYNGIPSGKDHPLFDGGVVEYGPGWNDRKKRQVRERDNHTCQDPNCSVSQSEHLNQRGEKLHVHHLRKARDVDDAELRNAAENLITLCRDCHQRWEKIADAGLVPQVGGTTS
jgi:uncharacterized protein YjcR